jgi:hypothetical protein
MSPRISRVPMINQINQFRAENYPIYDRINRNPLRTESCNPYLRPKGNPP